MKDDGGSSSRHPSGPVCVWGGGGLCGKKWYSESDRRVEGNNKRGGSGSDKVSTVYRPVLPPAPSLPLGAAAVVHGRVCLVG